MTNIFQNPEKLSIKTRLFQIAEEALKNEGWTLERIPGSGKSSVRRMIKGKVQKTVSIRTSQDTRVAFPRTKTDEDWATLGEVDYVVASSVDSRENPQFAQVHLIEGDEMRARFDRAYAARREAGYTLPVGRGIWLSLYDKEAATPVTLVGAGAGLDHPSIAKVPLTAKEAVEAIQETTLENDEDEVADAPLTIGEAKRRLARTFGVREDDVQIIIKG